MSGKTFSLEKYRRSYEPQTYDKHIGLEIEFFGPDQLEIAKALHKADIKSDIQLKTDSSIEPDTDSYCKCSPEDKADAWWDCDCIEPQDTELCMLMNQNKYKLDLIKTLRVLNKLGAKVNKSCGLHVHLDMRDRKLHTGYNNLVKCQDLLFDLNPDRKDNGFCRRLSTEAKKDIKRNRDHYNGISGDPTQELGTIEIRMHSSTLNYSRISNWIDLLIKIVDAPFIKEDINTLVKFNKYITKDRRLSAFVKGVVA